MSKKISELPNVPAALTSSDLIVAVQSGVTYQGTIGDLVNLVSVDVSYNNNLVKLIRPDQSKGLQELQKQGVYPVSYNPQWGGMGYGGLPDGTLGEIATGSIRHDDIANIGSAAGQTYIGVGFKVSQNTDINALWIKALKIGNPTDNLEIYIYSDTAGSPNAVITNGTATAVAGKTITDNANGEWIKFTFATSPSLTANTQYYIIAKKSGAVDASNYYRWLVDSNADYPHGLIQIGDATPTWSAGATVPAFLIEPTTTILTSGINSSFDGGLLCYEGSPLNQSGAFYFKNTDLNHKRGTIHIAGNSFTKDKTIYDSGLGIDNNRIVIRCNATTGLAQVDLYEDDGTKHTVLAASGGTDISTGDHIVSVVYRAENDGSDYLKLYVDGTEQVAASPVTSESIELSPRFKEGHSTIGGGFDIAPTWTDDEDMSVLPSASGWTFTGTATESNVFVVDGGILYQNGAGYAATNTGYYSKTVTLNNSTGWAVATKIKITNGTNTVADQPFAVDIQDGTKRARFFFHEYYVQMALGGVDIKTQYDFTKTTSILIIGKGSDYYVFADGKLIQDGTGLLSNASASNQIDFGDLSATSGQNASGQWHYFKYYEGEFLPEYTGATISEVALWNADKNALLSSIYNSGTIQSVKTLAGINENYVKPVKQCLKAKGINSRPGTASTSLTPLDEMNSFCFGEDINLDSNAVFYSSSSGLSYFGALIDGVLDDTEGGLNLAFFTQSVTGQQLAISRNARKKVNAGLHYVEMQYGTDANTITNDGRELLVEAG